MIIRTQAAAAFALLALAGALPAQAADESAYDRCSVIASPERRLACFDEVQKGKLVKRTVTAPRPARTSDPDSDGDSNTGNDTAAKDTGPTELTQFNLTIKASCP